MVCIVSGLDLGKISDFSVLACLRRLPAPDPTRKRRWRYDLVWLETWELGTPYPAIAAAVKKRFETPQLRMTKLAVDFNGVGSAVLDIVKSVKVPAKLRPVLSTSGHQTTTPEQNADGAYHVPKADLVGTLIALLQGGLLKWDVKALPLAARLEKELTSFRETVTRSKNRTFGAESSQHDDMVLAVALAAWLGETEGGAGGVPAAPEGTAANAVAGAPAGVFASGNGV